MTPIATNSVPRTLLLSVGLAWLAPILSGTVGGLYKMGLYRMQRFDPELEPLHVYAPPLLAYLALSLLASWLLWRWASDAKAGRLWRLALVAPTLALAAYGLIKAITVESALLQRFAYCCCCMDIPTDAQTYARILLPYAF